MAYTAQGVTNASVDDVQVVLGSLGRAGECQCQRFRLGPDDPRPVRARRDLLCRQIGEGHGVLAFDGTQPVGWCSVAPRQDFPFLGRTAWRDRNENQDDPTVWTITCFTVRPESRNEGVCRTLIEAAVEVAREAGARTVEAYPLKTTSLMDGDQGDLHVGALSSFLATGFRVIATPSLHRAVVRYDF